MPNLKYFSGTQKDRELLGDQYNALYKQTKGFGLFGAFGRAALYQTFGYEGVAPLPLRIGDWENAARREIRVVNYSSYARDARTQPHPTLSDWSLALFDTGATSPPRLWMPIEHPGERKTVTVDPRAVRVQTRQLSEQTRVRTFKVGTHLLLEGIIVATQLPDIDLTEVQEQYAQEREALAEFTAFADSIRDAHPEEFLTPQQEAPFHEVIEAARSMVSQEGRSA